MKTSRPVILLILDGWGIGTDDPHNAIFQARTPTIDHLLATYPNAPIGAAGEHIGLAPGHQGSTEMGHLIMSAGRNVLLPQMQIKKALKENALKDHPIVKEALARPGYMNGAQIHLMGLLSNAGVHSYDGVCHELLEAAAEQGLSGDDVVIHIFADGRDTPPESLPEHVARLQEVIDRTGVGVIASLQGRFFAMDRDHRWERVEQAYRLLMEGVAPRHASDIEDAIAQARAAGETDEFITPTLIGADYHIACNDVVINFNYRVDREIEITKALTEDEFDHFSRDSHVAFEYIGLFPYYEGMPGKTIFERTELSMKNILPEILEQHGLTQYRITETEKWVYVTKIFNAMSEKEFDGEIRKLIPSDKVERFDMQPRMQAVAIAEDIAKQLDAQTADVYIANICNADMLGHTGNKEAAIAGCEAIDDALAILYQALKKHNGVMLITSDHGDAEVMWDTRNNVPHTQHTDNFVPFILVDDSRTEMRIRETGALRDVAPTMLDILGIPKPSEMDGETLIVS